MTNEIIKDKNYTERQIAAELGINEKQIVEFSTDRLEAEKGEVCVFRKKLGLFIVYKPTKPSFFEE